jgi:hypothetical protein
MGLGPVSEVALSTARDRAAECRKLVEAGADPITAGDQRRRASFIQAKLFVGSPTLQQIAETSFSKC